MSFDSSLALTSNKHLELRWVPHGSVRHFFGATNSGESELINQKVVKNESAKLAKNGHEKCLPWGLFINDGKQFNLLPNLSINNVSEACNFVVDPNQFNFNMTCFMNKPTPKTSK